MKRALVLSLVVVIGLGVAGFAQTLSGDWFTKVTVDLAGVATFPGAITVTSALNVAYTVGDWTFGSYTYLADGVWSDQDFSFAGVLGAFSISGGLWFDPDDAVDVFEKLGVDATVTIAGVSFGVYFDLIPAGSDLLVTVDGVAGDVTIGVEVTFGDEVDCDFDFNWAKVTVGFPFCCADVTGTLAFNCLDGFQYAKFCVSDLTIENLPWLTLGACVTFNEQTKTFVLTPSIDLGVIGCDFDLFYRLDIPAAGVGSGIMAPLNIQGIIFDGLQISCEIGGVQFTGITYFGPWLVDADGDLVLDSFPGILGYPYSYDANGNGVVDNGESYFEAYQIATTDDGCCGPFSFDVTVFFDEDSVELFDVAYLVASMELQIASQFTFSMGIETDVNAGNVNNIWFGFLVEW